MAWCSSGHLAPLMAPLEQFYGARASGAPVEATAAAAEMLSASMPKNYSPTTFMIQSINATGETGRKMDYVATITFVNAAGYAKAKQLAQRSVP